jgi:hypothetical protein
MSTPHLSKYIDNKKIKVIGLAMLSDYVFRYRRPRTKKKRSGVANIEPRRGSRVYGLLLDIPKALLSKLDIKEGTKCRIYCCAKVQVTSLSNNKKYTCKTYIMYPEGRLEERPPSKKYLRIVSNSAKIHGLPQKYIKNRICQQ